MVAGFHEWKFQETGSRNQQFLKAHAWKLVHHGHHWSSIWSPDPTGGDIEPTICQKEYQRIWGYILKLPQWELPLVSYHHRERMAKSFFCLPFPMHCGRLWDGPLRWGFRISLKGWIQIPSLQKHLLSCLSIASEALIHLFMRACIHFFTLTLILAILVKHQFCSNPAVVNKADMETAPMELPYCGGVRQSASKETNM